MVLKPGFPGFKKPSLARGHVRAAQLDVPLQVRQRALEQRAQLGVGAKAKYTATTGVGRAGPARCLAGCRVAGCTTQAGCRVAGMGGTIVRSFLLIHHRLRLRLGHPSRLARVRG